MAVLLRLPARGFHPYGLPAVSAADCRQMLREHGWRTPPIDHDRPASHPRSRCPTAARASLHSGNGASRGPQSNRNGAASLHPAAPSCHRRRTQDSPGRRRGLKDPADDVGDCGAGRDVTTAGRLTVRVTASIDCTGRRQSDIGWTPGPSAPPQPGGCSRPSRTIRRSRFRGPPLPRS